MQKTLVISIICMIALASFAVAEDQPVTQEDARKALDQANALIVKMAEEGFSVQRMNDTLFEGEQIFIAQTTLGEKADFSTILDKTSSIDKISTQAYLTSDELSALKQKLEQETGDMTDAWTLYNQAHQEFVDERYEQSLDLVDQTYSKISELQALNTKLKAIYDAGTGRFVKFLKLRWKVLTGTCIVLALLIILFQKRVRVWWVDRKITKLKFERDILKDLIKKTQLEYFQTGKIPESIYNIRTKKFGQLIRDINRRIPLFEEKKEQIRRGKFKNVKKDDKKK